MESADRVIADYRIEPAINGFAARARAILHGLPEWFGRPEALDDYAAATDRLQTFVALDEGGAAMGFVTIARHTAAAAELYVIAVTRMHHRRGCGRQLVSHVEQVLRAEGMRWLTVKTLAASCPDPHYARMRLFYERLGFEPLEVFPDL